MGELMPMVYDHLSHLARHYLARERNNHTLDTRALVHEAYYRLVDAPQINWQDRQHFYVTAARAMRRILCDHARRHKADKRGGGTPAFTLTNLNALKDEGAFAGDDHADLILSVDRALEHLEQQDPEMARLVELRFFYGLTIPETAEVLGVSARTVNRDWQIARGFLHWQLEELREN